jgi:hypothetical protein
MVAPPGADLPGISGNNGSAWDAGIVTRKATVARIMARRVFTVEMVARQSMMAGPNVRNDRRWNTREER